MTFVQVVTEICTKTEVIMRYIVHEGCFVFLFGMILKFVQADLDVYTG